MVPALMLACSQVAPATARPQTRLPEPDREARIPVLAWIGPPAGQTTPGRYRELAECGFTQNFSSFPNLDAVLRALEVGRETGIKVFVACPELAKDPEGTVRKVMDHPALAGYHLQDEPSTADFPRLAEWARRIQAVDPRHGVYINLLPTYASPAQLGAPNYQAYLDRYLAEVPVPYLSWDHYPVVGTRLRPDFYENLELCAAAARKKGIPFWAFALAVAHDPYPIARLAHLRLQVYSNLAYGAQGIQYFTYWTPGENPMWNFHQAPIERNGTRTIVYNRVKQVNEEIRALSPFFRGARVVKVGHTGARPAGTQTYRPEAPLAEVETGSAGALISVLENGSRRYLAVVNHDFTTAMPLTLKLDGSRRLFRIDKAGRETPLERQRWDGNVEPGDLALFGWRK